MVVGSRGLDGVSFLVGAGGIAGIRWSSID